MNVTSTTKMDDAHRLVEVFTNSNTISSTQLQSEGVAVEIWNKIPWALMILSFSYYACNKVESPHNIRYFDFNRCLSWKCNGICDLLLIIKQFKILLYSNA